MQVPLAVPVSPDAFSGSVAALQRPLTTPDLHDIVPLAVPPDEDEDEDTVPITARLWTPLPSLRTPMPTSLIGRQPVLLINAVSQMYLGVQKMETEGQKDLPQHHHPTYELRSVASQEEAACAWRLHCFPGWLQLQNEETKLWLCLTTTGRPVLRVSPGLGMNLLDGLGGGMCCHDSLSLSLLFRRLSGLP